MRQRRRQPAVPHRLRRFALAWTALALLATPSAFAQLVPNDPFLLTQQSIGGLEEAGDRFGAVLAAGDFDGDGASDLAVGTPAEGVGAVAEAGAVFVVYGVRTPSGGSFRDPLSLHQDVTSVQDAAETGDRFGDALAVGDFNGDGYADLAVGVPNENYPLGGGASWDDVGAVHVFYGGASGLVPGADDYFQPASFAAIWAPEDDDLFGAALVACDRDGDGYDELAIGIPGKGNGQGHDGAVLILDGSSTGVDATVPTYWSPADVDPEDRFGAALACGNVDGAGHADLVVGAPNAEYGLGGTDSGAVWVRRSTGQITTLSATQEGGRYGASVALGAFGGGVKELLLTGAPGHDSAAQDESGRVNLWEYGGLAFLTPLAQGDGEIDDAAEPFDHFGERLAVGDFDRDGRDDAVFGVPGENLPGELDAGIVQVVNGSTALLYGQNSDCTTWTLTTTGLGTAAANEQFGAALAVGDFDENGVDDLAVGVPGGSLFAAASGYVVVLYGQPPGWIFGDDFEGGNAMKWSARVP